MHPVAEPNPFQQFHHIGPVARLLATAYAKRQGDIVKDRHVIEQAEILDYNPDSPADHRQVAARNARAITPEISDQSARRLQSEEQQTQSVVLPAPDGPLRN